MNTKPVIFHLAKWYPNKHDNMLGIFVKRHVMCTLPFTKPVVLYAMASEEVKGLFEIHETLEEGIHTYRCYYKKKISGIVFIDKFIKLLLYALLVLKMYYRAKRKQGKPSLMHTHVLIRTAVLARFIQTIEQVPYIVLEHSSVFIKENEKAFNSVFIHAITKYVVKHAKSVMTVSSCLAQGMQKKYDLKHARYEVVYNCVDTTLFSERINFKENKIKEFIYIAEFDEASKNTTGLLEAISTLSNQRNDFIVYLVGYGSAEALLHCTAERLGIKDRTVIFTGKLLGDVLVERLKKSDALLLFSNFETLSCVITEASCCGVPVIATAVGGVVEIVNPQNGILIPKADQEAMVKSLNLVIDNKTHWDSHVIAQEAQAKFSNESIGQQFFRIYNQAMTC